MKILLPTLEYYPQIGGISSYISNQIRDWPHVDDSYVVCAPTQCESEKAPFKVANTYYFKKKPSIIKPSYLGLFWYLLKIVKKENIDQIHIHHVLPLGMAALLLKKFFKKEYVVFLHGMDFYLCFKSHRKTKQLRKILQGATRIIVNSNYLKEEVVKFFTASQDKIKIVHPCPSFKETRLDQDVLESIAERINPEKRPLLLTSARLSKRKGHDMVIKSLPLIKKRIPNILYVICGQGEEKNNLKALVHRLHLHKNVLFINFVTQEKLPYLYKIANIFIMPCRQVGDYDIEGFGIVYLEANLVGVPVIGGRSGGVADAIEHNKSGLLVNPLSKNEIVNSVIKLIRHKDYARQMSEYGYKRVVKNFNWPQQLAKI